jgi:hypothetical protein
MTYTSAGRAEHGVTGPYVGPTILPGFAGGRAPLRDEDFLLPTTFIPIMDTRAYNLGPAVNPHSVTEKLPDKITGTYREDYNILVVHNIIRKKLEAETLTQIPKLLVKLAELRAQCDKPQSYIMRSRTVDEINKLTTMITQIQNGARLAEYESKARELVEDYRRNSGRVKTVVFDSEDEVYKEFDDVTRARIRAIERFLEIASDYIEIEIVRKGCRPSDICMGCGATLTKVAPNDEGSITCPECQTEHPSIILTKLAKDGARVNINNNSDDESIENFLRVFIRYQGLQQDQPNSSIYDELDIYFRRLGRPTGAEIRNLPLNDRGRRGDTTHKMLWNALSQIGHSEAYEDANLIGHIYWGWILPNVSEHKEKIVSHYMKTQKVFYQIPPEERGRNSSLGTQYRLWRHLQLVGHDCHMEEFKIAENPDSIRTHNKLWKLMCDGAKDPEIRYIP